MAIDDKRAVITGCTNAKTLHVLERGGNYICGMWKNNNSLALHRKSHSLFHIKELTGTILKAEFNSMSRGSMF